MRYTPWKSISKMVKLQFSIVPDMGLGGSPQQAEAGILSLTAFTTFTKKWSI